MADTHPLRFGLVVGQREPWPELVARARLVEELGLDTIWVVDHFMATSVERTPTHEAYSVLAGLAMATERVRLGTMVAGNTYRNPAFLLKQAVTVDHISNGRVDFGLGAGWSEREHEAYGYEFPTARERVDMFEEAVEAIDQFQKQEHTTYHGEYYTFENTPFEPKPIQKPRMPMLLGAGGPRMLRITARHADIWNTRSELGDAKQKSEYIDEQCRAIGRDPDEVMRSVWPFPNYLDSVDNFKRFVDGFRAAGFTDFVHQWPHNDQEHQVLRELAADVIPRMRGE